MVNRITLMVLLLATSTWAAGSDLQDPLRPLGYKSPSLQEPAAEIAEKKPDWRLGAVLIAAERSVAVINGQSLQVGDKLDGYKLIEIKPDSATLQGREKKIVLHRAGTGLKKAFLSRDVGKRSQP